RVDREAFLTPPDGVLAGDFATAAAGFGAHSAAALASFAPERARAPGEFAAARAKDCSNSAAAVESAPVVPEEDCGSARCCSGISPAPPESSPASAQPIGAANRPWPQSPAFPRAPFLRECGGAVFGQRDSWPT